MRTRNKAKETVSWSLVNFVEVNFFMECLNICVYFQPTKEKSKSKRSEVVTPEPEVDKKPFSNNISETKSPGSTITSPGDKNKRKVRIFFWYSTKSGSK